MLPPADAFMVAMLSRPASGTLATTRVTLVSIVLAGASFVVFALAGGLVVSTGGAIHAGLGFLMIAFGLWSLTLALFGILQRTSGG